MASVVCPISDSYQLMEAEVLEFLLSHQYNNKTCCHNGVRFLSNLLIESQKYK